MPAVTEAQRVSRDYIRDRRGAAAELIESAGQALTDLKYQLRVQQDKLLSAGDTQQTETVLAQAEHLLEQLREALPALQTFEDRFAMPGAFDRLKAEFVSEGENARDILFGDNYEAMTWLADRVLLFAKHLSGTLVPWVRNAIDEINQWMVTRAQSEDEAPAKVAEAKQRLAAMQEAHPHLRFAHSEGLLRDAERFLAQMATDCSQNYHKGVAENAAQAIAYADGALTMAEEALGFAEDPRGAAAGAREAIHATRASREASGRPVPGTLRRAEELLAQAEAAAAGEAPDWPRALLLYNQASAAFADALAEIGDGVQ
jgi:hypothetical protein